jgi:hypothetical protein
MANINDIYPSRYLKAADLGGATPTVSIARVVQELAGRARESKLVVYFVNKTKGLLLNKTNALALAAIAGSPETDHWVGLKVQLFATTATFGGQSYPVVRVQAAAAPVLERVR